MKPGTVDGRTVGQMGEFLIDWAAEAARRGRDYYITIRATSGYCERASEGEKRGGEERVGGTQINAR